VTPVLMQRRAGEFAGFWPRLLGEPSPVATVMPQVQSSASVQHQPQQPAQQQTTDTAGQGILCLNGIPLFMGYISQSYGASPLDMATHSVTCHAT